MNGSLSFDSLSNIEQRRLDMPELKRAPDDTSEDSLTW